MNRVNRSCPDILRDHIFKLPQNEIETKKCSKNLHHCKAQRIHHTRGKRIHINAYELTIPYRRTQLETSKELKTNLTQDYQ